MYAPDKIQIILILEGINIKISCVHSLTGGCDPEYPVAHKHAAAGINANGAISKKGQSLKLPLSADSSKPMI